MDHQAKLALLIDLSLVEKAELAKLLSIFLGDNYHRHVAVLCRDYLACYSSFEYDVHILTNIALLEDSML